jgi:hypothetical protein
LSAARGGVSRSCFKSPGESSKIQSALARVEYAMEEKFGMSLIPGVRDF